MDYGRAFPAGQRPRSAAGHRGHGSGITLIVHGPLPQLDGRPLLNNLVKIG